eukprot:2166205-Amphidinium_carterae.2
MRVRLAALHVDSDLVWGRGKGHLAEIIWLSTFTNDRNLAPLPLPGKCEGLRHMWASGECTRHHIMNDQSDTTLNQDSHN